MKKCRRRRKYPVNDNYFKTWSHPMAYILGFSMADSTISCPQPSTASQKCFIIELAIKDSSVVRYIRDELSPTRPIACPIKNTGHKACRLKCTSDILCNDLESHNVIPRRTGREELPTIPDQYKSTYLRGLFDGDGSITCGRKHVQPAWYHSFRISMSKHSKSFLEDVNQQLLHGLGYIYIYGSISELTVSKRKHIMQIYQQMYSTPGSYLKRKKDVFEKIGQL